MSSSYKVSLLCIFRFPSLPLLSSSLSSPPSPSPPVDRPQEALIEAQILISHSDSAAQQAKKLKLDQNAFETDGFLAS